MALGRKMVLCLCCAFTGWALPSPAWCEPTTPDEFAAEALFRQGKRLLEEGQFADACEKLKASQALQPGVGTLLFLGECYEKAGKSASAWLTFRKASELAEQEGDDRRSTVASVRAAALEPRLAKLLLRTNRNTKNSTPGFSVHANGEAVPERDLDLAKPIDPGSVRIEVTAPDHERWEQEVIVAEGPSEVVVDLPPLLRLSAKPAAVERAGESRKAPSAHGRDATLPGSGQRITGASVALLGLASVAAGAYFGYDALKKNNKSERPEHCPELARCFDSGIALRDDARQSARFADIAVAAGGALSLTGLVVYVLAPEADPEQARSGWFATATSEASGLGAIVGRQW